MTARSLVDRCVDGDADAWRQLHRELFPLVVSFLLRMGVPPTESEDVCQDVFERLFRSLHAFEGRAELKTWLYRVCLTEAGRLRRQRWFRSVFRWPQTTFEAGPAGPTERADLPTFAEVDMERRIVDALDGMKKHHREVFVLYEIEGLPGDQIAQVLACPVATVWRRLHHARHEFTDLIKAREALS